MQCRLPNVYAIRAGCNSIFFGKSIQRKASENRRPFFIPYFFIIFELLLAINQDQNFMKKLLLCLLLGANLSAYSQFYLATVTEFTYPAASTNLAARSEHSSAYSYSNLIGLKIDNQGNFLIPAPTQVEYSMVADQLNEISPTLSIALSGSNIQSSGLFMAFAHLSSGGYSMSIKATDWVDAHFRPTDMEDGRI